MNQKIYLVKKDPAQVGGNIEWIQMSGTEFYAFTKSPAAKGRYFIRLTDDISYECPEIFIEASYADYRKWQKEYDAHRYLKEQEKGFETVSADMPVTSDSVLLDTIASPGASVEDEISNAMEVRVLLQKIQRLPTRDRYIITASYLESVPKSGAEIARELQITKVAVHKRLKKILKKLSDLG